MEAERGQARVDRGRAATERGQATIEWLGIVLLVAVAGAALIALDVRLPGTSLAGGLAGRLACLAGLEPDLCVGAGKRGLIAAYGFELATEVRRHAPTIEYEAGMRALPVDFRRCRSDPCSLGGRTGAITASRTGEPVTLFVHVVDCRAEAIRRSRRRGYDCSGERTGDLYIQYWAYYPGSQTSRVLFGDRGFHPDDWESLQVRLSPGEAEARASSHHGYNYTGGIGGWASDVGLVSRAGWGRESGHYFVSGGSHAGHVHEPPAFGARLVRRIRRAEARGTLTVSPPHPLDPERRWTPAAAIRLVPLERIARRGDRRFRFATTPPWRKGVWRDPEDQGTD